MKKWFSKRYKRHYQESKMHLIIDLAFVLIILILITANIILSSVKFPIESVEIKITRPTVNGEVDEKVQVVNTNLILNINSVYYTTEGEQLGIGPWPPVVGETTDVRIFLDIQSDIHSIKDAQIKIKLPDGVKWTNNFAVTAGNAMLYDETSNLIFWYLDKLSVNQLAQANFEIEFTPTPSDAGQKLKLIDWLSATASDTSTQQTVSNSLGSIYWEVVD